MMSVNCASVVLLGLTKRIGKSFACESLAFLLQMIDSSCRPASELAHGHNRLAEGHLAVALVLPKDSSPNRAGFQQPPGQTHVFETLGNG
jgi:hypothetical protein